MHYYQFNIGDYSSHTSRLSLYEDIAYRRLLDLYYLNERPLNGCLTDVAREIGMQDSEGDVEYILNKFFTKDGDSWRNKRCDMEIKAYHNKQKSASKAGKASAKARQIRASEQTSNDRSTDVQPNINHKPITINQEPIKKRTSPFVKPTLDEVKAYCDERQNKVDPQAFTDHYEANGWMRGKTKIKSWKACVRTWESNRGNGNGQRDTRSRAKQVNDELDRLAKDAIERGETV